MRKRVVITGMGCVSPVGNDPEQAWSNIRNGRSGIRELSLYDTQDFKVKIAAEVRDFDPRALFGARLARKLDRFSQFAYSCPKNDSMRAQFAILFK